MTVTQHGFGAVSSGLPSYILDTEGSPLDEDENFERTSR